MNALNVKYGKTFRSFFVYFSIVLLIFLILKTDVALKSSFINSFNQSAYPSLSLLLLATLISSVIWTLFYLGFFSRIKVGVFEMEANEKILDQMVIFKYVPPWVIALFSLLSLVGLLIMPPSCAPPNILFNVATGNDIQQYTPESVANIENIGSAIISVTSDSEINNLICEWNAKGDIARQIDPNSKYCSTTIFFKDNPGVVIISTRISRHNCPNYSHYNFSINVKN